MSRTYNHTTRNSRLLDIVNSDITSSGPPQEFKDAIFGWLDESLPPIIKRGVGLRRLQRGVGLRSNIELPTGGTGFPLVTDPEVCDGHRVAVLKLYTDYVTIISFHPIININVMYEDPCLFDVLKAAIMEFYNG